MKKGNTENTSEIKNNSSRIDDQNTNLIPVVAIGASAGGIESFLKILNNLSEETGFAYVFVQHMDPNHKSLLPEILKRETKLPIVQVEDNQKLEANKVFIMPSDADITISKDTLKLLNRPPSSEKHLPIDKFFTALAREQKNHCIGIILSGTANDGTNGLKEIKEVGGFTIVQDPDTAKYTGMPHNAINSLDVDFILSPEAIAAELNRMAHHPYILTDNKKEENVQPEDEGCLQDIFSMLYSFTQVDFSQYKPNTIKRRINKRMLMHKCDGMGKYSKILETNKNEIEALFHDLLINVTGFFRDPEIYESLKKIVFPKIATASQNRAIRIWIPGCSTGEEVYSIAIVLLEFFGKNIRYKNIQIFATDVSEKSIEKARAGVYPESIAEDVSPERLRNFFYKENHGYQINKKIRDLCVFARQDLAKDPPFTKIDFISCRNLLIYFNFNLQKKIINTFHYALNPEGLLLLGNSETIGSFSNLFSLMDRQNKIYMKKHVLDRNSFSFSYRKSPERNDFYKIENKNIYGDFDVQKEADKVVLSQFTPPALLINDSMEIIQFRGNTESFLRPAPGTASLNLYKMAREELVVEFRTAIHKVKQEQKSVKKDHIQIKEKNGFKTMSFEIIPIKQSDEATELFYLILLTETPGFLSDGGSKSPKKQSKKSESTIEVKQLQQDLKVTKEYLQSIIYDKEAANEELKTTLEELQSSNEELQSINEEMETAKEELQSTNEELTTVNDELQNRNSELSRLNNDLINFLGSVHIPIIILGNDLRIKRFTPMAEKVLNLIPTDIGRPISDLRINLSIENLNDLILEVIDKLEIKEIEVFDKKDQWYSMRIRPYKTLENQIDGAIIALIDITELKEKIEQIKRIMEYNISILETVREPILVLDKDLNIKTANHSFYNAFKLSPKEVINKYIYSISDGKWNISALRSLLDQIIEKDSSFEDFGFDQEFTESERKKLTLNARKLTIDGQNDMILLAMEIDNFYD